MPPTAHSIGTAAAFGLASEPVVSSCLRSSPTVRKKMVSRPSCAQCPSGRSMSVPGMPRCVSATVSNKWAVAGRFARTRPRMAQPSMISPLMRSEAAILRIAAHALRRAVMPHSVSSMRISCRYHSTGLDGVRPGQRADRPLIVGRRSRIRTPGARRPTASEDGRRRVSGRPARRPSGRAPVPAGASGRPGSRVRIRRRRCRTSDPHPDRRGPCRA